MLREGASPSTLLGRGDSMDVDEPAIKLDTFNDERVSAEGDAFLAADDEDEELGSNGTLQKSVGTGYLLLLTCSSFG